MEYHDFYTMLVAGLLVRVDVSWMITLATSPQSNDIGLPVEYAAIRLLQRSIQRSLLTRPLILHRRVLPW